MAATRGIKTSKVEIAVVRLGAVISLLGIIAVGWWATINHTNTRITEWSEEIREVRRMVESHQLIPAHSVGEYRIEDLERRLDELEHEVGEQNP